MDQRSARIEGASERRPSTRRLAAVAWIAGMTERRSSYGAPLRSGALTDKLRTMAPRVGGTFSNSNVSWHTTGILNASTWSTTAGSSKVRPRSWRAIWLFEPPSMLTLTERPPARSQKPTSARRRTSTLETGFGSISARHELCQTVGPAP